MLQTPVDVCTFFTSLQLNKSCLVDRKKGKRKERRRKEGRRERRRKEKKKERDERKLVSVPHPKKETGGGTL